MALRGTCAALLRTTPRLVHRPSSIITAAFHNPTTAIRPRLAFPRLYSSLVDPNSEMVTVNTTERLAALRSLMNREKVDVYGVHRSSLAKVRGVDG